jgi:hypothetical protein
MNHRSPRIRPMLDKVKSEPARLTGRMMVTGAIVYDWLYDLLTREEKEAFIAELIRLAKTQECGYVRRGSKVDLASGRSIAPAYPDAAERRKA